MGRGALVFKGEKKAAKKKKKRNNKSSSSKHTMTSSSASATNKKSPSSPSEAEATEAAASNSQQQQQQVTPEIIQKGKGKITTSGTVVTGHANGTQFEKQIQIGDAILVNNQEMRIVTMRLSNISLNISSPFTRNYSSPIPYQFIPKPRRASSGTNDDDDEKKKEAAAEAANAFATTVYRERTEHGSYRLKKFDNDEKPRSREELLDLRSKKTSDKYC